MRHFLDNQQYNTAGILRYEKVFGAGFVSTGGAATTAAFVDALALRPGDAVLDVGCGIGGGAFYMAARHGARVHGVDLSVNMVLLAMARAADARADAVSFEIADVATVPLPAAAYDVVYSRDTILHVADKKALLERLCAALKPGGRLLVTDYCSSGDPPSPEFGAYIAQRGYHLLSVPDYGAALCAAGFADVEADDRTWQFKAALDAELARAREGKAAFVAEFSEADYDAVVGGWEDKLRRVAAGEQRWGLFTARRPAEVGHVGAATGAANGANGH
jgi:phosphoethanolamine N-methyltransferase